MTALYQNNELTLVQCECHIGKLSLQEFTQLIGINCLFCVFNNFLLLSPNFQGANACFATPADAHAHRYMALNEFFQHISVLRLINFANNSLCLALISALDASKKAANIGVLLFA